MTMTREEMRAKVRDGNGFIAALDQSGGSTPGALKGYGIGEDGYSNEQEMFGRIHEMRSRIITSPSFTGKRVLGAILFERTMDGKVGGNGDAGGDGDAGGRPVPEALNERGVVPFLKIDKGLEEERDGVRLMKPNPTLDALLERAVAKGMFGTKMRSVIDLANEAGIAAVVGQQFEVALQVLRHGLVPIIEPEVSIKSAERGAADELLKAELIRHLDRLPEGHEVMLKLSIPAKAGTFDELVRHPRVLRVVALSGGFSRADACAELARNPGMIASFSRALLEDLRHSMSAEEFDRSLGEAIDQIYAASTDKVPA